MKHALLLFLLLAGPVRGGLTWVRDRNAAVATGTASYEQGNAIRAVAYFSAALTAHLQRNPDPHLVLDLAHAQTRAGQPAAAQATYGRLLTGSSAAIGSIARQQLAALAVARGETAQALGLLRQALLLDPKNSGARFNYEILSEYVARQHNGPKIPPPPQAGAPDPAKPPTKRKDGAENQAAEKAGTDRPGEVNDSKPGASPSPSQERQADPTGQPDQQQRSPAPGSGQPGSGTPGQGPQAPLPSGDTPGSQRGLDRNAAASPRMSRGNGAAGATAAATDLQLQTQRERLQAMNLSPAQARQLLETLRAQEQQYLQQLTPPIKKKPDPSKPTW